MRKGIFVGVDQTGAVDRSGKPKRLPACLIKDDQVSFFYLDSFSKSSLLKTLDLRSNQKIVVCVDCVIGLPQEIDITWRKALQLIKTSEGYGQNAAQKFFFSLGRGQTPSREVERRAKANSVFKERPFQKNIQTGTYRIWKDIASSSSDFAVPFLHESIAPGQIQIFEGYPSLSWKLLFNVKSRTPDQLPKLVRKQFPELVIAGRFLKMLKSDENLADAFVLALSLKRFRRQLIDNYFKNEGWILGQE